MADKERLRLRSTVADLLSPAQVNRGASGTVTDHDEPAGEGGVKGSQGQDGSNADGPAAAADNNLQYPKNALSLP